jgi:hypothetical protein
VFKRLERDVLGHRFNPTFERTFYSARFEMNLPSMFLRLYVSRKKIVTFGVSAFIIGLVLGALLLNLPNFNVSEPNSFISSFSLSPGYSVVGTSAFRISLPEMTLQINATQYSLPVNLSQVQGYQELKNWLQITPDQEQILSQNGFVVLRTSNFETLGDFYDYAENGMPILVTTDAVLHTYHVFFDEILQQIETDELAGELNSTINALLAQAQVENRSLAGTALEKASKLNLMYLEVAHALMDPSFTPTTVEAQEELQLISAHSQMTLSPIFGYVEDYTQYVPRGHYTESELLEAYFRTMMWLGRMRFELVTSSGAVDVEQTRAALLFTGMVAENQSIYNAWERIYAVTEFFVGASDDLTFEDYLSVLGQEGITTAAQILDENTVVSIAEELLNRSTAKVVGTYAAVDPLLTPQGEQLQQALNETAGLRFMGQRFIPDSYIFQQLVYPQVGNLTVPRLIPKGLDVPAVLGSDLAQEVLNKTETVYENYTQQIDKLGAEFATLNVANWTQDLYWSWLYTANTTLAEIPSDINYPTFMTTSAWSDEKLQTFEGTWTELRHDTILYAEQSYTIVLMIPPPTSTAYVEPYPETYRDMIGLINMTMNGLMQLGLLQPETNASLTSFMEASELFLNAATIELEGKALDENLQNQVRLAAEKISDMDILGVGGETQEASMVADVHTDPNTGQVLEEGLGNFSVLVVVYAGPDGTLYAAAGPVFNYYEFTVPISNRLTDEAWRTMLANGQTPEPPEWTDNFAK